MWWNAENRLLLFAKRICGCDETLAEVEVEVVHLWKRTGAKSRNSLLAPSRWGFGFMSPHLPMSPHLTARQESSSSSCTFPSSKEKG